jgi:hypothetical protein
MGIKPCHQVKDWKILRLVEGPTVDIGKDLDPHRAKVLDGSSGLFDVPFRIVHRQGSDETGKPVRVLLDQLCHAVVCKPGQFVGDGRRPKLSMGGLGMQMI